MAKTKNEIAVELLEKYPDTPTLTLARMMYEENPALFNSLENARSYLRYRRGNNGVSNRKEAKSKKHFKKNGKAGYKFEIPESIADPLSVFNIPDGRSLVFADAHFPYHDYDAVSSMLEYADGGIHLTQATPTYSITGYGRLPPYPSGT